MTTTTRKRIGRNGGVESGTGWYPYRTRHPLHGPPESERPEEARATRHAGCIGAERAEARAETGGEPDPGGCNAEGSGEAGCQINQ